MNLTNIIKRLQGKSERDILNEAIDKELEKKELQQLRDKLNKLRSGK